MDVRAKRVLALWAALMLTPVSGLADDVRPTVIELYTSQGCSSCPPADALLTELAAREGVVALALHVDYWDYIGWKDEFADPAYSKRQKSYARARGEKMVYTPQMVVNGSQTIVGVDATGLAELLKADANRTVIDLDLERVGDRLSVRAAGDGSVAGGAIVQLVRYIPQATVQIDRGENAGRSIVYTNVVTSWQQVAEWDGTGPLDLTLDTPGDLGVAVLVQAPGPGRMVAAAALD